MTEWRWVDRAVLEAVHDRQLAEHGGGEGLRDEGGSESAIARAVNRALYENPTAAELAAAYAFGIARNHPFVDGNKRTAWVAARLFLALNGISLNFDKADATLMVQRLAAGELGEDEVTAWFAGHID
ncbi:type II toxin-antitoxin system death-on-curing family toxin [Novosphingopyxis iocasae]|uniref:type II toxin-antitoxin system death-on-curing family toxin n=1 Tax=Novosphingopyxis iocasae TaxID=2762729 RepID=UPI0016516177|nr:type II toxin-antitoxin system death-on-curing family toxin [Novosphingopyxis iocasae]